MQPSAAYPGSRSIITVPGAGTTHFRRSEEPTMREVHLSRLCVNHLSKNPPADVPVRVRQPVVAVDAGEAGIRQPIVQVAEAQPPKRQRPPADA